VHLNVSIGVANPDRHWRVGWAKRQRAHQHNKRSMGTALPLPILLPLVPPLWNEHDGAEFALCLK